jgi:hypothetical protein
MEAALLERDRGQNDYRCYGSWLAMNNVPDKGRMELMGHRDPKMTMRYMHLSMEFKQAVQTLPQFGSAVLEGELQRFSQQPEDSKLVRFGK